MSHSRQNYFLGCTVATEFICDDYTRPTTTALQQFSEEPHRSGTIPLGLHQNVNDRALLINSPPQVVLHSVDLQEDFVQKPLVAQLGPSPLQFGRIRRSERIAPAFPEYRMQLSNPLLLEDVLVHHPKLRVYICHAGWPFINELLGLLYAHPHVYVDVAVINWVLPQAEFHAYLRRIVDAGLADRIMYGTDNMNWPDSFGLAIIRTSAPFLTENQKRDVLCRNAAQFLRLKSSVCEQ